MINNKNTGSSGKQGPSVRTDCYVEIEIKRSGGLKFDIKSKVEAMYGDSIKQQLNNMCSFFGLKHASIKLEDSGALPFIIAAIRIIYIPQLKIKCAEAGSICRATSLNFS